MMKRNIDSAAVMIFQPLFCKLGKSQHFTKFSLCLCLSFDKRERKSCIKISWVSLRFFSEMILYTKTLVLFPFIVLWEGILFPPLYFIGSIVSCFFVFFCWFSFLNKNLYKDCAYIRIQHHPIQIWDMRLVHAISIIPYGRESHASRARNTWSTSVDLCLIGPFLFFCFPPSFSFVFICLLEIKKRGVSLKFANNSPQAKLG